MACRLRFTVSNGQTCGRSQLISMSGKRVAESNEQSGAIKLVRQLSRDVDQGSKIRKKGGELIMKARVMTLTPLLFAGLLVSSCATVDKLNTESEEETTRVERMSPQDKADWEKVQHENFMIDMKGYFGDGD